MRKFSVLLFVGILMFACSPSTPKQDLTWPNLSSLPALEGHQEYIHSPSVTAGDRVYLIGHQDGTFPDLGWHITGEMGGLWLPPVKLMDGFALQIKEGSVSTCLDTADQFVNYPVGNKQVYTLEEQKLEVERFQFVPDGVEGMVVDYRFSNHKEVPRQLEITFSGFVDLRPVWLGERTNMIDAPDSVVFDSEKGMVMGKDKNNPWFVYFGARKASASGNYTSVPCISTRKGLGQDASVTYQVEVAPNNSNVIRVVLAGSTESAEKCRATYESIHESADQLLAQKVERYQQLEQVAEVSIPDKGIQTLYQWNKYTTDWLIREVPGIGRGLAAGYPDYPWWFGCDNTYTLQGALASGRPELVRQTLQLLYDISAKTNGNGRVVHETSTNGAVFNPGNLNETPHFAFFLWQYVKWTGDTALMREYYPFIKQGMDWTLAQDKDGNLIPEGFGMMEIHGLDAELIDVAVYTQAGLNAAGEMGKLLGDPDATTYAQQAAILRQKINDIWWVASANSYADFIGSKEKTLELIESAIIRADTLNKPWAVEELEALKVEVEAQPKGTVAGQVVFHNWVVNTPMEIGIADSAKALAALETAQQFTNPFGMFVTGIDRDESAGKDELVEASRKKAFSYLGAVMTLPTGVQAIGELNYGRTEEAYQYMKKLHNSFGYALPGSMYEVSPDFGMAVQA
ncbi:MAG: glycogen debranching protein [Bacteroidota bacterium]